MRLEPSLSDALDNSTGEPVIILPRVWSFVYRAGMSILLLSIVIATVLETPTQAVEPAQIGTLLIAIAFIGPYLVMAGRLFIQRDSTEVEA